MVNVIQAMREALAEATTLLDCDMMRIKLLKKGLSCDPSQLYEWLCQMVKDGDAIAKLVGDGPSESITVFAHPLYTVGQADQHLIVEREFAVGDMVDMYREMKEAESARRAERRVSAPDMLRAHNIVFDVKNGGAHLIINTRSGCVDFWPGTQRWISRLKNKAGNGRGFKTLLSFLEIPQSQGLRRAGNWRGIEAMQQSAHDQLAGSNPAASVARSWIADFGPCPFKYDD